MLVVAVGDVLWVSQVSDAIYAPDRPFDADGLLHRWFEDVEPQLR